MKKIILLCLCILLCLSTFTGCFSHYVLGQYKPDLSKVPLLNKLSDVSFEYLGNTYEMFCIVPPDYMDWAPKGYSGIQDHTEIMYSESVYEKSFINASYFSALIGTIPCTIGPIKLQSSSEYRELIYASPYDPDFNMLLAVSSYSSSSFMFGHSQALFVKEGYVPFQSIYDIPLAELYRIDKSNTTVDVMYEYGVFAPLYFRYKVGDLSGENITINSVIEDEVFELYVGTAETWCSNFFLCNFDGHDYLSALCYEVCYDKDKTPYIRVEPVQDVIITYSTSTSEENIKLFYRVKEEYRDIFAWEYFGCEGHIDPDAKYDPDNEGTENPGGEGTENPDGEGTENPGGEGAENPGSEGDDTTAQ